MNIFRDQRGQASVSAMILVIIVGIALLLVAFFGIGAIYKTYSRYQKRADEENDVKVLSIQVKGQQQRVRIAKQKAEIRLADAVGIRKAQDEINETLTPFYLTHEYIQALRDSHASTVYIPTDPSTGLPVVTTRNAGGRP